LSIDSPFLSFAITAGGAQFPSYNQTHRVTRTMPTRESLETQYHRLTVFRLHDTDQVLTCPSSGGVPSSFAVYHSAVS